jgi:hypothetical protein
MEAGESRQRLGRTTRPLQVVAAIGMARSIPGWSQTRQTRPNRCWVVMPSRGSSSP